MLFFMNYDINIKEYVGKHCKGIWEDKTTLNNIVPFDIETTEPLGDPETPASNSADCSVN